MHIEDFLCIVEEYQSLGWAVQEQLKDLLEGEYEEHSLNKNAVAMIKKFGIKMEFFDLEVGEKILEAVEDYENLIREV